MAITMSVDNNRTLAGIQPLLADESAGVQTPATTDDGNEINVLLSAPVAGTLSGFASAFNTFLNSASLGLTDAQKVFASDHDGASSASNFVLVTTSGGETISNLFFADSSGGALVGQQVVGMKTLDGQDVYLWSNGNFGSSEDFCVATTSNVAGSGEVVAAFYLNENTTDHKSAQIQMVTFEPLEHNLNGLDPDDAVNFTDALRVAASGSLSFNFDVLDSGKFLWAAIGSSTNGLLISGLNLFTDADGKAEQTSDFVNTSQGGLGATIGIDNQMFTPGDVAVLTLVEGFQPLTGAVQAHSDYLVDTVQGGKTLEGINYTGYTDAKGAKLFFSQDQGSGTFDCTISLWEAGGASGTPEQEFGYVGTEPSGAFQNDTAINARTITVYGASATPGVLGPVIGTWAISPSGGQFTNGSSHGGVTVTISGNSIDISRSRRVRDIPRRR